MADKMKVLSLFAGIGGFDLGLERAGGFEVVAQCEIDPFCRAVLKKHWPHVRQYEDVRTLTADVLERDGITDIQVIAGGFPCQDISNAGNQEGLDGERSGLWFEFDRLIGQLRPSFVIVENVRALLHRGMDEVLGCFSKRGYDAWWEVISAEAVGLPHERERVWIVAHTDEVGWKARSRVQTALAGQAMPWTSWQQMELRGTRSGGTRWLPNGVVCAVDNGLSPLLDGLGQAGNAVVPQIPELIGRAIMEAAR